MAELKPCPFCGSEIKKVTIGTLNGIPYRLEAECEICHAEFVIDVPTLNMADFLTGDAVLVPDGDAVAIWNRRADNG